VHIFLAGNLVISLLGAVVTEVVFARHQDILSYILAVACQTALYFFGTVALFIAALIAYVFLCVSADIWQQRILLAKLRKTAKIEAYSIRPVDGDYVKAEATIRFSNGVNIKARLCLNRLRDGYEVNLPVTERTGVEGDLKENLYRAWQDEITDILFSSMPCSPRSQ
jgi:hypothetical protein